MACIPDSLYTFLKVFIGEYTSRRFILLVFSLSSNQIIDPYQGHSQCMVSLYLNYNFFFGRSCAHLNVSTTWHTFLMFQQPGHSLILCLSSVTGT